MSRATRLRGIAATLVVAFTVAAGAGVTGAAPNDVAVRDAAIEWLAPQVTEDGALISPYTDAPDPGLTAQAALALAGAGAVPETVATMIAHLQDNVEDHIAVGGVDDPGAIAWRILDAVATDVDPTDFGGVDLEARLSATQQPDGLFGAADATYDGAFRQGLALIALAALGEESPDGVAWLLDQQCDEGGFVALRTDTSVPCPAVDPTTFSGPDTNSTAFAAMGLALNGETDAAAEAIAWLESVRTPEGGFAYLGDPSEEQDANSTGLVLLAFRTVQGDMDSGAIDALASLQVPASGEPGDRGGIAFQAGDPLFPDLMATTQALLGLAGQALPFTPVEPDQPTPGDTTPPARPAEPGTAPGAAPATPVGGTPSYTG